MKHLNLVVIVLLFGFNVFAAGNPQIRACNVAGGRFTVMNSLADHDQIGLCQFDYALVGAIDILNRAGDEYAPQSLAAFKNGELECTGEVVSLARFELNTVAFCRYNDGSLIDMVTLNTGKLNPRNSSLTQALGL